MKKLAVLSIVALASACAPGSFDNPLVTDIRIPIVTPDGAGTITIGTDGSVKGEGIVVVDGESTRVVTVPIN